MIRMGQMMPGSTCCKCGADIGGHFGVEVNKEDYCSRCWEGKKGGITKTELQSHCNFSVDPDLVKPIWTNQWCKTCLNRPGQHQRHNTRELKTTGFTKTRQMQQAIHNLAHAICRDCKTKYKSGMPPHYMAKSKQSTESKTMFQVLRGA